MYRRNLQAVSGKSKGFEVGWISYKSTKYISSSAICRIRYTWKALSGDVVWRFSERGMNHVYSYLLNVVPNYEVLETVMYNLDRCSCVY